MILLIYAVYRTMILKEPGMKFMGHTVVAGFDKKSSEMINELMRPFNANKIPFGRNCDREAANREMDYHMTVFHWAKSIDSYYLEKIKGFSSEGFDIRISDVYFFPRRKEAFFCVLRHALRIHTVSLRAVWRKSLTAIFPEIFTLL